MSCACLTDIKTQKVQLKLTATYKQLHPCSLYKDKLAAEIKVWFAKLNTKWGRSDQDTFSGFCSSDDCNEIDVKVKCSPSGKRRRREVEQGVAYITVDDLS